MQGAKTSLLRFVVGTNPEDIHADLPHVAIDLNEEKRLPEINDSLDVANYLLFQLDYEYQSAAEMHIYEITYPVNVRESVESAYLITVNEQNMVTMVENVTQKLKSDIANVRASIANDGRAKFLFVRLKR
jgi:hypothetical protein